MAVMEVIRGKLILMGRSGRTRDSILDCQIVDSAQPPVTKLGVARSICRSTRLAFSHPYLYRVGVDMGVSYGTLGNKPT